MKKVLITGGAGFIGSNVALKLIAKGIDVTVLDNLSPQIHGDNPEVTSPLYQSIKGKVRFVKGTVTSRDDWRKVLDGVDAVLHLAAETGTAESRAIYGEGRYWSDELNAFVYPDERPEETMSKGDFEVKYPGCLEPLKLVGTTEDSKIHPGSVYGITKQVQGQLVHMVCQSIGIESVSFRYQNVYGPGQSLSNPYTGILSIFSTRIKNGNGINIFEDGKETRDFVYIDDIADATILGLTVPGVSGNAFNIGTGVATDVLNVANTLKKYYGIDVPITVSGNYRLGDIRHNFADITKARKLLGFEPRWSFDKGIEQFCRWVDSQPIQQDNYEASIEEMKQKGLYK